MRKIIFPREDLIIARAYRLLRKAVYDEALAQSYSDGLNCGVLGGVLPEREYLLLPGVTTPFTPPLFPGDFPDAGSAAQKMYLHRLSLYEAYSTGMANVRLFLVASIEVDMMATLDEEQLGFRFSVTQILAALEARFNLMSPLDLITARTALSTQYIPGSDMRTFIKLQRELHLLLAENNAIVNNNDQFEILLASVSSCGQFVKVVDNFLLTHSTVISRTFQSLSIALVSATDSLSSVTVNNFAHLAHDGMKGAADAKVTLTGKQPANTKERIVTITQYYCSKHKWCNTVHKSPSCVDFVEEK
jgi:hypothetical protein